MMPTWRAWTSSALLPGGHFFIDQFSEGTARVIARFVGDVR